MPAPAPPLGKATAKRLAAIGARLRAHRKALRVSATTAAEAAGMARATLHRIERGEPSVTIGAYMSAIAAIGLDLELIDRSAPRKSPRGTAGLPKRIELAEFPALHETSLGRINCSPCLTCSLQSSPKQANA